MNNVTKLALGAGLVAAAIEYPLGKRYPLAQPVSMPVRMSVAAGLAIIGVLVAARFLREEP